MPHKLLLGFKQNPTTGDDYIDLGGGLNDTGNKGYHLKSYLEGAVALDDYGHMVRDLTIVVDIDDETIAGAMARYHDIDRYIQQTRKYLEPFEGNWAGTTDGTWYEGFCATLTFQPVGASAPVYWDVLGGSLTRDETYLGVDLVGGVLENVTVTLTVRYSARGDLVTMNNLVAMGSFEPPFNPKDAFFDAGWTFTSTTPWSVDYGSGKFGPNSLKWAGASSTTAYTNANRDTVTVSYDSSHAIVTAYITVSAQVWLKASGVTGGTTVTLEGANALTGSPTWVTLATLASAVGNLPDWTLYKAENVSLNISVGVNANQVRLKIVTPTAGTVYFDGAAIYKGATVPGNGEYFTSGLQDVFPSAYLYNAAGDVEAPCILHVGFPYWYYTGPNDTSHFNAAIVGARKYKWNSTGRDSIPGMAAMFANGTTDDGLYWGKLGQSFSGTATSATFNLATGTNLATPILKVPRKYQVYVAYYSNIDITSMDVWMEGDDPSGYSPKNFKTFVKTIPASDGDQLFYAGDMTFPEMDTSLQNQLYTGISAGDTASRMIVRFNFPSAAASIRFNGLVLVPYEMSAFVSGAAEAGYTTIFSSMSDPERGSVRALQGNIATYQPEMAAELYRTATDNSDRLQVIPGAMQFEILAIVEQSDLNPDVFFYNTNVLDPSSDPVSVTLVYQPRYLSGGM